MEITGIRWLLKEHGPEKAASSLVIYMRSTEEVRKLRMGRRLFRTTRYDWGRGSRDNGKLTSHEMWWDEVIHDNSHQSDSGLVLSFVLPPASYFGGANERGDFCYITGAGFLVW